MAACAQALSCVSTLARVRVAAMQCVSVQQSATLWTNSILSAPAAAKASKLKDAGNAVPAEAAPVVKDIRIPQEQDELERKFINLLMLDGKKSTATAVYQDLLQIIKTKELDQQTAAIKKQQALGKDDIVAALTPIDARAIFSEAIDNVKPIVGTTPMRKGSTLYQVPTPLTEHRRRSLAIKWIVKAARARTGKPMADRLYEEVMASFRKEGSAYKRKLELQKLAEANRAFAHLRK